MQRIVCRRREPAPSPIDSLVGGGHGAGTIRLVVLVLLLSTSFAAAAQDVRTVIQAQMEQLLFGGTLVVRGVDIAAKELLPDVYAARDFAPLWEREDATEQLAGLVGLALEEGLDAGDYPLAELRAAAASRDDAAGEAAFDILASEILVRVSYHLRFGKVNPATIDATWNFERHLNPGEDPVRHIQLAAAAPSLAGYVRERFPRGPVMVDLVAALAQHRAYQSAGGWPTVSEGPTLKVGDEGRRVGELRKRLAVTDGLGDTESTRFDSALDAAVRGFQSRHALSVDGAVGPATLRALNVPVEERIRQIRLSLERGRWVTRQGVPDSFVLVNIAGFQAAYFRDRKPVWSTRVQVGKPYRQTPVFRGDIAYLQVNPTWTVPPGILRKDVLPAIRRDPNYLTEKDMMVLTTEGVEVDPGDIDWTQQRLPYIFRQRPGPGNALGRIKFIFPNPHFVFLHDTPSRELFQRSERAFSSGCIRVQDPLALAELLLDDPDNWSRADLEAALATRETRNIYLKPKVSVFLYYLTALVLDGRAHFYVDVYGRDAKLLEALQEAPVAIDLDLADRGRGG